MAKYRKKPVVIEAIQWTGENWSDLRDFGEGNIYWFPMESMLEVKTLEGVLSASKGDWIIKGVKGEFYPCKPDIFTATYEPVE